jgi:hypothetical protein
MAQAQQRYMAAEQASRRYLTGNLTPGWETTPFVSSAKVFDSEQAAADAARPLNEAGRQFVAVPAQVLA